MYNNYVWSIEYLYHVVHILMALRYNRDSMSLLFCLSETHSKLQLFCLVLNKTNCSESTGKYNFRTLLKRSKQYLLILSEK